MALSKMFWMYAQTGVHMGSGQGVGFIDLPIMREKVTNWPIFPGSAIKGVLRDYYAQAKTPAEVAAVFGHGASDMEAAGALVITDARIVLLPVRSLYGTYAYITSPLALRRLARDIQATGDSVERVIPEVQADCIRLPQGVTDSKLGQETVYLEELDFKAERCSHAATWAGYLADNVFSTDQAWNKIFQERFGIVSDEAFDFLCEVGTEVNARIRIDDETKTAAEHALWYEEILPAESVLAGIAWCDKVFSETLSNRDVMDQYCDGALDLQIGGKATVGKGRVRCIFPPMGGATSANTSAG